MAFWGRLAGFYLSSPIGHLCSLGLPSDLLTALSGGVTACCRGLPGNSCVKGFAHCPVHNKCQLTGLLTNQPTKCLPPRKRGSPGARTPREPPGPGTPLHQCLGQIQWERGRQAFTGP